MTTHDDAIAEVETMRERVARALFLVEKFGRSYNDDTYGQVAARINSWDVLHEEDFDLSADENVNPYLTVSFECEDGSFAAYGKEHFRIRADAAIAAMAGVGWQPIETAPRDGTDFLALIPFQRKHHQMVGCFAPDRHFHSWPGRQRYEPSHWRLLPPANPSPATEETPNA